MRSGTSLTAHEMLQALEARSFWDIPENVIEALSGTRASAWLQRNNAADVYWLKAWACRALQQHWFDAAQNAVVECAQDKHWRVRLHALRTLGVHGDSGVTPLLSLALEDPHWRVRHAAAVALGRLGDVDALPALHAAFWDDHETVQAALERSIALLEGMR